MLVEGLNVLVLYMPQANRKINKTSVLRASASLPPPGAMVIITEVVGLLGQGCPQPWLSHARDSRNIPLERNSDKSRV